MYCNILWQSLKNLCDLWLELQWLLWRSRFVGIRAPNDVLRVLDVCLLIATVEPGLIIDNFLPSHCNLHMRHCNTPYNNWNVLSRCWTLGYIRGTLKLNGEWLLSYLHPLPLSSFPLRLSCIYLFPSFLPYSLPITFNFEQQWKNIYQLGYVLLRLLRCWNDVHYHDQMLYTPRFRDKIFNRLHLWIILVFQWSLESVYNAILVLQNKIFPRCHLTYQETVKEFYSKSKLYRERTSF